jgi:hypothetical protein
MIKNVPRLSLLNELKAKFSEFGEIENTFFVDDPEIFTVEEINSNYHKNDAIVIKFKEHFPARLAKRKMSDQVFYG